jgi:predicted house-cleaning noncanonical NTP pyrophosphatase (MazG superfamily)
MITHYNKLVRDNIPNLIEQTGKIVKYEIADSAFLKAYVKDKILEEAEELFQAESLDNEIEEVIDLLTIINKFIDVCQINKDQLNKAIKEKGNHKGFFENNYYLLSIEDIK